MDKDLTVIIPAYNAENTIVRAIESAIETCDNLNYEVIVVNDGSKDQTAERVALLSASNTKVVLLNQENLGRSEARNAGVAAATGYWVMFLDADDVMLSSCASLLNIALYEKSAYMHVFPMALSTEGPAHALHGSNPIGVHFGIKSFEIKESMIDSAGFPVCVNECGSFFEPNSACARLYKRERLLEIKRREGMCFLPFPLGLRFSEDMLFNYAYLALEPDEEVVFWPEFPIYWWDLEESSTTNRVKPTDGIDIPAFAQRINEMVDAGHFSREEGDKLITREVMVKFLRSGRVRGRTNRRKSVATWTKSVGDDLVNSAFRRCGGNVTSIGYKMRFQFMMDDLFCGRVDRAYLWSSFWNLIHIASDSIRIVFKEKKRDAGKR